MVRKKGTQVYSELVKKYCNERRLVESYQKEIDYYTNTLKKDEEAYNNLTKEFKENESVKQWYEDSTSVKKQIVGLTESNLSYSKERMERYALCLKNDYEEDLDELYSQNKPW